LKVLITGGAGFIGSTVASACEQAGHEPVLLDDLSTGLAAFALGRPLYVGDAGDPALIDRILSEHPDLDAVVHCAAKIVVPDSVAKPLDYYANNVGKGVELLRALARGGVTRFVFSSSASIYAVSEDFTVDEGSPVAPASPYATTKAMFETILEDATRAGDLRAVSLRYFNPIGADPELRTGLSIPEPSHALGKLISAWRAGRPFTITGTDWPTHDGTGIRDYVHVWDLARAHVAALERFDDVAPDSEPYRVYNIGTGMGVTVRELVTAFEGVVGEHVEVVDGPPRPGDSAGVYTRSERAEQELGWRAERSLEDGIRDSLAWAERLPGLLRSEPR